MYVNIQQGLDQIAAFISCECIFISLFTFVLLG